MTDQTQIPSPESSAPEPAAAPAEPSNVEVLQYDPFADMEPAGEGSDPAPTQQEVPDTGEPPQAPQPPATDPAVQARIDVLERIIAQRLSQPQEAPPQPQQPQAPQEPTEPELPPYTFTIPPQLQQMFDSEDPQQRLQAISLAMTGTAKAVHVTLAREFGQALHQVREAIPRMMMEQMENISRRQTIFNDFYGTYPQLAHPNLRPLVREVTQRVYAARGGREQWSPGLRDAIATEVAMTLHAAGMMPASLASQQQPQPAAPANGRQPIQPPNISGTRGPVPTAQDKLSKEILDLMDF